MNTLNNENNGTYMNIISQALDQHDQETFRAHFLELHPSDQVDIFVLLKEGERKILYSFLEPKEFAIVFSSLYFIHQRACLEELTNDYFSEMLNGIFTDNVARFLKRIDEEEANDILKKMDTKKAKSVQTILKHDLETAGAVMTSEYITTYPESTVEDTLYTIKYEEKDAEIIYYTYAIDKNGVLKGVVSLKKLITANPKDKVSELMSKHVITIPPNMEHADVGKVIQKYDLLALPVVTESKQLIGIITVDDVMDLIERETTKRFGEFSTVKDATETDISAFKNAKKRAPWIIFLMFAGLVTSGVIGRFEDTLESVVTLAAFMPMLMDSGGNVGTQSLAVSVRGLALGTIKLKNIGQMIMRELTTGFLIGFTCMVLISILIFILYGKLILGVVVGVSLLLTLSISAVIGLVFPLILNKFKVDPAIASGPFITTINDVVGLLIYFSIATTFMQYL